MGRWRRPDLEEGWADRATAAQMLGKTVRTLLQWHRQGKGPLRRHNGNGIRYRITEIEDWLRRNPRNGATSAAVYDAL
jgi:predicted site-specific integrase-resolvase